MSSKKDNFFAEVEKLKELYRRWSSDELRKVLARAYGSDGTKVYHAAAKAVLRERGEKISK